MQTLLFHDDLLYKEDKQSKLAEVIMAVIQDLTKEKEMVNLRGRHIQEKIGQHIKQSLAESIIHPYMHIKMNTSTVRHALALNQSQSPLN